MPHVQSRLYRTIVFSLIVALLAVNAAVFRARHLRSLQAASPIDPSTFPLFLTAALPDVSGDSSFESTISYEPLLNQRVRTLVYNCEIQSETRQITRGNSVNPEAVVLQKSTSGSVKRLTFAHRQNTSSSVSNTIEFREQIIPSTIADSPIAKFVTQQLTAGAHRRLALDGRYMETNAGRPYVEIDAKFPDMAIEKGSHWNQRLKVPANLNPNGIAEADIQVVAMFVRDGARFARIHRQFCFRSDIPSPKITGFESANRAVGGIASRSDKPSYAFTNMEELFDFNIDKGIVESKSSVSQMSIINSNLYAIVTTTRTLERLVEVVAAD